MKGLPQYELIVRVTSAQKLATIISLLDGEARLLGMKEITDEDDPADRKRITSSTRKALHYVGGKRDKGISGADLLTQLLADGRPHPRHEIERAFIERGFSWLSVSPVLSVARKEGRLLVNPDATVQLLLRPHAMAPANAKPQ